jgi:hypothetical protein
MGGNECKMRSDSSSPSMWQMQGRLGGIVRMHAIASAIAGSLRSRTSTAPTGSRTLPPPTTSPGWPAQPRVYAVVHPESVAGSPVQPRVYAVAARNAAGPHQTSSSRSVEQWPRLPLGGWRSCGIHSRPTREQQLAGSPASQGALSGGGPF